VGRNPARIRSATAGAQLVDERSATRRPGRRRAPDPFGNRAAFRPVRAASRPGWRRPGRDGLPLGRFTARQRLDPVETNSATTGRNLFGNLLDGPGMRTIDVAADYRRTPLGSWAAAVDALLHSQAEQGFSASAAGATLAECQARVMELVSGLSHQTGRPCLTMHLLDGDAAAFIQAYRAEVGFDGWLMSP
jgi:hypothetical protein